MRTVLRLFVVLFVVWLIGGCSSGGGDSSTTTGQFVDDPVQGLDYVCSSGPVGVTSAEGEYTCGAGDNVTFSIGPVTIGTIAAQSGMITPYSFFPNDLDAAYNLARLLQSLDTTSDDFIIVLDDALVALLPANIDFSSETFAAEVESALNITLVSLEEAQSRLNDAILAAGGEIPAGGHMPIADAGIDQNVNTASTVALDGSSSSDADGDALTYLWSMTFQPAESQATLSDASLVKPTFEADTDGRYVVELIVNDGMVDSAADTVTITATTANAAPVANAGVDQNVNTTSLVNLDGSASSDANPGDLLTYSWSITSAPSGSSASLSDATLANPTFTADLDGNYDVQLVVNDGTVDSAAATVTITATTANAAPVANAGIDQNVETLSIVTLDGSASSDANPGDVLTYFWSITTAPLNSNPTLTDATLVAPTFDADLDGDYVVQLIVNDGTVDSAAATVTITATTANAAPVADAGVDQDVETLSMVTLDGSASSDANPGDVLTYFWSITSAPSSIATLSDATLVDPTFDADMDGSYVLQLIVNDGTVDSVADTVTISATTNTPPVADAGIGQFVEPDIATTLNGHGSSDPDGDPLTYRWSIMSAPSDSKASILGATNVTATFTPDVAGSYVMQLIVNDGMLNSVADTMAIASAVSETVTYNLVTYKTVVSPYTSNTWLDRNLGASQVCATFDDASCYGDYYQWGRLADAHQAPNSGTTWVQATDVTAAGTYFITASRWAALGADDDGSLRVSNWSETTDGTTICPSGYQVPTIDELAAETVNQGVASLDDSFNNFLKIPAAGARTYSSGTLSGQTYLALIWSRSNKDGTSGGYAWRFWAATGSTDEAGTVAWTVGDGHSVRCIETLP